MPRPGVAARGPEGPPPAGGFGVGEKRPVRKGEGEVAPTRARSPRRHGDLVEVSERMKEWRDRDVQERRERLASASGHGLKAWRSAEQRRNKAHSGPSTATPVRWRRWSTVTPPARPRCWRARFRLTGAGH